MYAYETLIDLIVSRKAIENQGITFIYGDCDECFVSYKELYFKALSLLNILQEAGFKEKDEVVLQIDNNKSFVITFWACVLGGMIPVPITAGANDEHKMKLFRIWNVLNNPRMVSTADFLARFSNFAAKNGLTEQMSLINERTFCMDDINYKAQYGKISIVSPEDIAFIQFSSGSTGEPKGVIITHKNVLINLSSVIKWINIGPDDSSLNWMPLTHDMGLIGTHIKSILACINQYNIETSMFIRHPTLWIEKASEHKVTLLYSPNFGYKHFLKFLKDHRERSWDLSAVRFIFNGAEPISVDLCNEFLDKMSSYGLKRTAMYTVYGLAEGTIAVTFPKLNEELSCLTLKRDCLGIGDIVKDTKTGSSKGCTFADLGYPIHNCYMRICDENDKDLGENKIGYVHIRGGNVTRGYYNNKEATQKAINNAGWLNTGDLGFLRNGRLVITGRAKDVIFISGQNYYSHDIERTLEEIDGVELGKSAAIGVFNEGIKGDELILFILSRLKVESFIQIINKVKELISRKIGIEVSKVIPIKNIPKTTSGKVQRFKLRESYLNGDYDSVLEEIKNLMDMEFDNREIDLPQNAVEKRLLNIWTEVLNVKKIGMGDDFFQLGGDSLRATQLISRIRETFGVELEQAEFFGDPKISKLAKYIERAPKRTSQPTALLRSTCNKEYLPLSFSQERLWFLNSLNGESAQYNLYSALRLRGSLNHEALKKSLNEVVNRHDTLKMSFTEIDGQPLQIINHGLYIDLPIIDLSETHEKEREKNVSEMLCKEAGKPFALEKAPLIRGKLYRMDKNDHILLLTAHHIIFDGWSFAILLKELVACYEAYLNNREHSLPPVEFQYADFASWQKHKQNNKYFDTQLQYWREKLSGTLPTLNLHIDKVRPAVQTYKGARFTGMISSGTVLKLKDIAQREGVTLYMVLLAAFKVLLYKYTGQEDIIVGSPVANRNRLEYEPIIGFFTNNLVLRTVFSSDDSFSMLLKNVREVTLKAYENQDIPFERLVDELHVARDMSRNPIFQILFGLHNVPTTNAEFTGINMSTINIDSGFSRFDLSVDIYNFGEDLQVDFEYNTDLFYPDTISQMAEHYFQALSKVVENPLERISKIDILTSNELRLLLKEWNNTKADFCNNLCWIDIFEEQVGKNPDAIAVISGEKEISYDELNKRANQLANFLISIGVKKETIVGIYTDRSINMLVALLGVHKAGGAYLPLDPIFPKERLEYMLENSQASVILTVDKLIGTFNAKNAKIVCIDSSWTDISRQSSLNPVGRCTCENLAYIIYTSGSTGKPKGAQIEHRALSNFLLSMERDIKITAKDALLAVTTLSFDIAGLEMFLPLIAGARVVIANNDDVTDGEQLAKQLDKHEISFMQATPATWRLLVDSGWMGRRELRILCGGEALPQDLANQLLDRCSCLWNVYGPTETTIWSTMVRIEEKNRPVIIGKPIANTEVYILDNTLNLTPVGIPGELYIGGDGLARGYLHLPELTKEKFILSPFSSGKEKRLYKTGDLVRYMPDGSIEFVGRIDHQVKIRGFRIELGEVETVLNQNSCIRECVVLAREVLKGEKSLVAYIIPQSKVEQDNLEPGKLREYLKGKLPDYMIPSYFVIMDSFPMTPNGKIDRKAMPLPQSSSNRLKNDFIAASNEIEINISKIWKEVLGIEAVGMNDNFFDLGGHSLLLAKVRSKMAKEFKKDISMLDLFNYPTIKSLAKFIEKGEEDKALILKNMYEDTKGTGNKNDIAIVGLSARVPGAKDIDQFWKNLCDGVESITTISDDEIMEEGISPELLKNPNYVKAWGVLEDVDKFDARFFGYNPREAIILDPQQRIFLEESWKALENAGYDSEKFKGLIGTFASVGMNTYINNLSSDNGPKNVANNYQIMINNDKDFLATRVSYKLNLEGPGLTVQTACSSSLVAVHLACQSLINGECDMALAGGVSIRLPQKTGYIYQDGMILSPDGHCRAFDENARGTIGGNGAGVVVLKRLKDAIEDGDTISAVIKGSAINNDGNLKVGYTAPRVEGQASAIAIAQRKAGVDPQSITYIETHGTGTPLGDPIEMEALNKVFGKKTEKKLFCAIGSVKTNVGHLDSAAGVTGLIKTVLALKNKIIPPSLNFERPNPKIDFHNSPFYVNTNIKEWKSSSGEPLRAGISSFGIGGTNAHVVLEEGPLPERSLVGDSSVLLVFSAKTPTALNKMTENFINFLKEDPGIDMSNAAFTLQVGRREFDHKRFLVCNSREDAIKALENINAIPKRVFDSGEAAIYHDKKFDDNNIKGYALEELGHFWLSGVKIDWNELSKGSRCKRIPLPHYPFEGQSYWAESKKTQDGPVVRDTNFKNSDISEWFYSPIWKQSAENITFDAEDPDVEGKSLLVLLSENEFENRFIALLRESLKESGVNVITAVRGEKYQKINDYTFFINHGNKDNYEILLKELDSMGKVPAIIINMFGITSNDDSLHESIDCGRKLFYSMIFLAQAIGKLGWKNLISIKVLTNNLQRVFGEEKLSPGKALVIGPHKVIPREYPNIKCSSIDFLIPESNSVSEEMLLYNLLSEVMLKNEDVDVAYRGSERWIQEFEKVRLNSGKKPVLALKKGGVYLITGGLGAIGLVFAQYLAKEVQARLILVSRVSFPDMNEVDQWVNNHDYDNNTSLKIKQLKRFQELGAEIIVCQADVKDAEQVKKVCTMAIDRFGEINGVIHAAGIPGGGMIQLKNREFCENVFSPKVEGTMALYYALKDYNIDFIILNSSLNAITGGFGQSDYSSANAFMDTFAKKYNSQGGTRIISINWDRWPGVGMAVNIEQSSDRSKEINPLLGRKILNTPKKIVYLSQLSPEKDWVLSEHKVMGIPTVAGTTYLEMARAAFLDISGENAIYISDVTFLTPMAVRENGKQDVITILTRNGTGFDFKVFSKPYTEDMQNISWQEHARGRVESAKDVTMKKLNLAELFKKCNENIINTTKGKGDISQEFISFGDRWNSLNGLSIGSNEGIVEVEIKEDFKMDLERFKLHPALLDVATGSIRLICGGNYLPLSYESIVVKGWLKKKIFGYIRFKDDFRTINEIITCDIDILSDKGEELVTIKNFSMKLINDTSAENIKSRNSNSHLIQVNEISKLYRESIGMKASILSEGITPDEGCAVLTSVLKGCYKPQVIVSTKDILSAIKQASYIDQLDISKDVEEDDPQAYHPRPELSCEYVGPRNETEQKLVGIWQRLLGIDKVGILDDFFELGGDSLLLVQLHSKIKDIFKTDISTVDLYKYNTVSLLRKFFDEENSVVEKSSFESVNQRANKKLEMIKQRRKQMIMKGMN